MLATILNDNNNLKQGFKRYAFKRHQCYSCISHIQAILSYVNGTYVLDLALILTRKCNRNYNGLCPISHIETELCCK